MTLKTPKFAAAVSLSLTLGSLSLAGLSLGMLAAQNAHAGKFEANAEEMSEAVAQDARNYSALGQAQFETARTKPLLLVNLDALAPDEQQNLRERRNYQLKHGEPLQIGIARDLGMQEASARQLSVESTLDGGFAQRFSVRSAGASAVRLGFQLSNKSALAGLTLRFGGANGDVFEVKGVELNSEDLQWTPVVAGDLMTVEISVDRGFDINSAGLQLIQVSHLDIDPAATQAAVVAKIGESDFCERDVVCRTSPPANFRSTADSVARMVFTKGGSSFLCTGTLLNNNNATRRHLFWSANHCISSQTVANTLQTYWFYEATTCGGGTVSSRARTLTGGAFLRSNNTARDTLLLELKTAPPAGAIYAGWSSAAITSTGIAIEGIHHPAGDVKMYSLGSITSTSSNTDGLGPFYRVQWSTGVTEGGSSGSGLYTRSSTGAYQLRGGLYGGLSFCTDPTANDYYSRFSDVYTSTKPYLSP